MGSENYFVVRQHPKIDGAYTYVEGFEFDDRNNGTKVFLDIKVKDTDPIFFKYEDALNAALEDYSEFGVVTHPECKDEELKIRKVEK